MNDIEDFLENIDIAIENISQSSFDKRLYYITIQKGHDIFEVSKQAAFYSHVIYSEPFFYRIIFANSFGNNSLFDKQWNLVFANNSNYQYLTEYDFDINILPAWKLTTGSPLVKTAVIDDGIWTHHSDLKGNVSQYVDFSSDIHIGSTQVLDSMNYHGTACAGIIGALDNNIGIIGVSNTS